MKKTVCEYITPEESSSVRPDEAKFTLEEIKQAVGGKFQCLPLNNELLLIYKEFGNDLPVNTRAMARVFQISKLETNIRGNVLITESEYLP